jgi:hypothetical protein
VNSTNINILPQLEKMPAPTVMDSYPKRTMKKWPTTTTILIHAIVEVVPLTIFEGYCLKPWDEAIGLLKEVENLEGHILAKIGPVTIALPDEMGERINPFIGQRIGVLRTENDYRFRVIAPSKHILEPHQRV